jgi:ribonuclease VapC
MIVDASAILAVVFDEADSTIFAEALRRPAVRRMSSVNFVEAGVRADNDPNPDRGTAFDKAMHAFGIFVQSVSPYQAMIARDAYRRFGKGSHPARLNLGDCFAFALAKANREPLLFKGRDFAHPDILAEIEAAL